MRKARQHSLQARMSAQLCIPLTHSPSNTANRIANASRVCSHWQRATSRAPFAVKSRAILFQCDPHLAAACISPLAAPTAAGNVICPRFLGVPMTAPAHHQHRNIKYSSGPCKRDADCRPPPSALFFGFVRPLVCVHLLSA
jgi:hypothetical protein